jgi:hypothetical protein
VAVHVQGVVPVVELVLVEHLPTHTVDSLNLNFLFKVQ